MEKYIIKQVEKCKHLIPALSEYEIVLKLVYHFNKNFGLAIYTQGIKEIEDMLVLV